MKYRANYSSILFHPFVHSNPLRTHQVEWESSGELSVKLLSRVASPNILLSATSEDWQQKNGTKRKPQMNTNHITIMNYYHHLFLDRHHHQQLIFHSLHSHTEFHYVELFAGNPLLPYQQQMRFDFFLFFHLSVHLLLLLNCVFTLVSPNWCLGTPVSFCSRPFSFPWCLELWYLSINFRQPSRA